MEANTSALEKMSLSPSFVDDDNISEASSEDDGGVLLDPLGSSSDDDFDDSELDDDAIWDVALAAGSHTSASSVVSNPQVPTSLSKTLDVQFSPEKPEYGLVIEQQDDSMLFGVWFIDCDFSSDEPTHFIDCRLEDVVFERCRFGASMFTGVVMKGARFEDCIFEDNWWAHVELPEGETVQHCIYLGERQFPEEAPEGLTDKAHIAEQERRLAQKGRVVTEPRRKERKPIASGYKASSYTATPEYQEWCRAVNQAIYGTDEDLEPKA